MLQLERLTTKDSVQDWVRKINKILEVGDMLSIMESEFPNTVITIQRGVYRIGTNTRTLVEQQIELPVSSQVIVGINTSTATIVYYSTGSVPNSGFIPLYEIFTDSEKVITINDLRTWAVV